MRIFYTEYRYPDHSDTEKNVEEISRGNKYWKTHIYIVNLFDIKRKQDMYDPIT